MSDFIYEYSSDFFIITFLFISFRFIIKVRIRSSFDKRSLLQNDGISLYAQFIKTSLCFVLRY